MVEPGKLIGLLAFNSAMAPGFKVDEPTCWGGASLPPAAFRWPSTRTQKVHERTLVKEVNPDRMHLWYPAWPWWHHHRGLGVDALGELEVPGQQ